VFEYIANVKILIGIFLILWRTKGCFDIICISLLRTCFLEQFFSRVFVDVLSTNLKFPDIIFRTVSVGPSPEFQKRKVPYGIKTVSFSLKIPLLRNSYTLISISVARHRSSSFGDLYECIKLNLVTSWQYLRRLDCCWQRILSDESRGEKSKISYSEVPHGIISVSSTFYHSPEQEILS
jgi:hypothetical protein